LFRTNTDKRILSKRESVVKKIDLLWCCSDWLNHSDSSYPLHDAGDLHLCLSDTDVAPAASASQTQHSEGQIHTLFGSLSARRHCYVVVGRWRTNYQHVNPSWMCSWSLLKLLLHNESKLDWNCMRIAQLYLHYSNYLRAITKRSEIS